MKKGILIVLVVFTTIGLQAQFEKGNNFIRLDGNYFKSSTESGVITNQVQIDKEEVNIGISVAAFVSPHIFAGAGLDYQKGNETRKIFLYFNKFFQMDVMNIKYKAILPIFFIGYYQQLTNRFYFNSKIKISVGTIKSENSDRYSGEAEVSLFQLESNSQNYSQSLAGSTTVSYLGAEICPELTYFASKKFGVTLGLGGIYYNMIDWKTESSSWLVNFNPNYWKLGVIVKI